MQQTKSLYLVILAGALLSLLIVSTTHSNTVYAQNKFRAKLDGKNEVPPVDSAADGVATFKIKDDTVKSKINITGITELSGAQIFMGKVGQTGDPIVDLLKTGEKASAANGVTVKGNFTASDFVGSMQGKSLSDLQTAMASNQTFVNIMTTAHPGGELAGHVYSKGSTTGAEDVTARSDLNTGVSKEGGGVNNQGLSEGGNSEDESEFPDTGTGEEDE